MMKEFVEFALWWSMVIGSLGLAGVSAWLLGAAIRGQSALKPALAASLAAGIANALLIIYCVFVPTAPRPTSDEASGLALLLLLLQGVVYLFRIETIRELARDGYGDVDSNH